MTIGFTSCSKDNDDPINNTNNESSTSNEPSAQESETNLLIGKWYYTYYGTWDTYEYLTLKKDGTGSWLSEYYDDDGRLDDRDRETFSWTYNSNLKQLTFKYSDGHEMIYNVVKLTEDYLFIATPNGGHQYDFERND